MLSVDAHVYGRVYVVAMAVYAVCLRQLLKKHRLVAQNLFLVARVLVVVMPLPPLHLRKKGGVRKGLVRDA